MNSIELEAKARIALNQERAPVEKLNALLKENFMEISIQYREYSKNPIISSSISD